MTVAISVREMLEAGVHFGHQTHRWDPRMKPYIYGARNGIYIIDLQKTLELCRSACDFVRTLVGQGGNILFVGTKRQAQGVIQDEAKRAQMFYVTHRWLGGTLTNFKTIKTAIDRLKALEEKQMGDGMEGLTKKERLGIEKDIVKLTRNLGGIKEMDRLPAALFIVDPGKENIAKREANRLGIPVIAVADTNCNPNNIDWLIAGNDDAIKSIRLFANKIAEACLEGLALRQEVIREQLAQEESEKAAAQEAGVKETVVEGKGVAYVHKPEAFEGKTDGKFKSDGEVEVAKPEEKQGEKKEEKA